MSDTQASFLSAQIRLEQIKWGLLKQRLLLLRQQEHHKSPDQTIGDGSVQTLDVVLNLMDEIEEEHRVMSYEWSDE